MSRETEVLLFVIVIEIRVGREVYVEVGEALERGFDGQDKTWGDGRFVYLAVEEGNNKISSEGGAVIFLKLFVRCVVKASVTVNAWATGRGIGAFYFWLLLAGDRGL